MGVHDDHRPNYVGHINGRGAGQRAVAGPLADGDRQTGGYTGDSRETPTLRQAPGKVCEFTVKRYRPAIAANKVVLHVEGRQRMAEVVVIGIQILTFASTAIERLSVSICREE